MSDVIKINLKGKKVKAVLTPEEGAKNSVVEIEDEEAVAKKLQQEYERGFNEGYARGSEEAESQYVEILDEKNQEFYSILKAFEEKIEEYENSFSEIVIKLAGRIAKKIIKREVESEPIIKEIIDDALSQVIAADKIIIRVNPDDYNLLENEENHHKEIRFNKIKFEPDASIEKGGCIVETEIGNVDARISSQITEIMKKLEQKFVKQKNE